RLDVLLGRCLDRPDAETECGVGDECRVPDAAQRSPGDAKHRPVRCTAEPGPIESFMWTPDQQRTASAAPHPGNARRKEHDMNFDDTPQEAAFRAETKAWI